MASGEHREVSEGVADPVSALCSDVAVLQEGPLPLGHRLSPACPCPRASAQSCAPAPTSQVWEAPDSLAPRLHTPLLGRTLNSIRLCLRAEKEPHPSPLVLGAQRSLLEGALKHGHP